MNEQHYKDAVQIAKNELDTIGPEFEKLRMRVLSLQFFIVHGTKLSGNDAEELDDKYKLPHMIRREMMDNRTSNRIGNKITITSNKNTERK